MRQFIDEVARSADIVILDSPPCVTVTDAVVLSQWADGVLVILDQKVTTRQAIQRARENLQAAGARVLGAVINRLDQRGTSGYYYSTYYSYYYYNAEGSSSGNGKNGKAPSRLRKLLGGGKPAKPKASPSDN
jgi:Mrp family chromosome partitioning ATPase